MANPTQQSAHDLPNDTNVQGNLNANVLIANGGFKAGALTPAPVLAAGAQAGGSPPAPIIVAGSTDVAGSCTFGTGSAPALGGQVTVTFGTPLAVAPKFVAVNALNDATGLKILYAVSVSTTGFIIDAAVAPAASQGATIYAASWFVVQ